MAAKEMEKQKKRSSSVCRVFKNTAYAVMSNYNLMSTAISLKATGLLSKVLNLPDKWDYSVKGLASICKEKETAIETALDELKDTGYLCVTKLFPNQTENKKIGYRYHFFEYSEKDKTVHIKPTDFVTIEKPCGSNGSKVCRVTKNANYTVMSSFFLRSKNLSLKAIGLLCKVLSLPDNWDYSIDGLTAICKDGRTVIKSALKELETWGYLKKTRLKPNETKSGRFEYFYDFYEISDKDVPQEETSTLLTGDARKAKAVSKKYARQGVCSQEAEIQEEEKQGVENLSIENRQQYNTKDKIQKNQICSDKVSINQSLSCAENAVENVENTIYSQSEDWIDGLMADKAKAEAQVRKNMTYKQLQAKSPSKLDSIEVNDSNIGNFLNTARKYDIDFALKRDKSTSPPTYHVFFSAAKTEDFKRAFTEYADKSRGKNQQRGEITREMMKKEASRVTSQPRRKHKQREKTRENGR